MKPIIHRLGLLGCLGGALFLVGCASLGPTRAAPARVVMIEATGYCACGHCCGWERSWRHLWQPTYAYGPNKGKPKQVGITATGRPARAGTIAADTRNYPFGTVMYVPGYGYGRVEDRGGAIQGAKRIDLFFESHQEALEWGRRRVAVQVWPAE